MLRFDKVIRYVFKYGIVPILSWSWRFRIRSLMFRTVLWTRILMDSHWFGFPGSRSVLGMWIGIQEQENLPQLTNKPEFQPTYFLYVLWHSTWIKYIFQVKSNFLRWQSLTWNRIWIRTKSHCFGSLDPDSHWGKQRDPDPEPQLYFRTANLSIIILWIQNCSVHFLIYLSCTGNKYFLPLSAHISCSKI